MLKPYFAFHEKNYPSQLFTPRPAITSVTKLKMPQANRPLSPRFLRVLLQPRPKLFPDSDFRRCSSASGSVTCAAFSTRRFASTTSVDGSVNGPTTGGQRFETCSRRLTSGTASRLASRPGLTVEEETSLVSSSWLAS